MADLPQMTAGSLIIFRERMGWSRYDLAAALDIARKTLRAYEAGTSRIPGHILLACLQLWRSRGDPRRVQPWLKPPKP